MLYDFLLANREAIISGAQRRVASRASPRPTEAELKHGVPMFLDQLGAALLRATMREEWDSSAIASSASFHGQYLLRLGLSVAQVVHDYGDICQVITELAIKQMATIPSEEFQTLNLCLDEAIAAAVTEYGRQRELSIADDETERLGVLAHEMRNLLNSAMLSFDSIRRGRVAPGGSTGEVHLRSLAGLRALVDRSLAQVRLEAGIHSLERVPVAEFMEEVEIGASMLAAVRAQNLSITSVDSSVFIDADRQTLASAVSNLLQNAFKFTAPHGRVSLAARATPQRVLFEVEDECGGLPAGTAEGLFRPFARGGADHTGLGLGLSICLKAVKANAGEIRVRDIPGKGCIFVIDMPRQPARVPVA